MFLTQLKPYLNTNTSHKMRHSQEKVDTFKYNGKTDEIKVRRL